MQYETLPDGTQIPVLGLGTWGIGGGHVADRSQDAHFVEILQRLIDMGYTHIDTAESYAQGHAEELVGVAIRGMPREEIFITTKVAKEHLGYDDVHRAIDGSLRRLGVDYVDLYLIHWPNPAIPLPETFRALNELTADGRVKRVGVSNFDVPLMQEAMALSDTPIATNQVRYNLLSRENVANGVLAFCQEQGIVLTAYSPLKSDVLTHPTVVEIARAHGATPAQVALKWLIDQPRVITIPKSSDLEHARENMDALRLELTAEETERLNNLQA